MADIDHARLDDLLRGIDVTDPALADLFDGMLDDSRQNVFADAGDDGDESAGAPGGGRKLGEKSAQIKPVLYVEEISIFERALRATGETNRGKAIIQVCQAYLEQTEGQLDI